MEQGTLETIVALISQVGFPIVVCGAMFWFINKTLAKVQEAISAMNATVLKVEIAMQDIKQAIIPTTKLNEEILKRLEE